VSKIIIPAFHKEAKKNKQQFDNFEIFKVIAPNKFMQIFFAHIDCRARPEFVVDHQE